MTSVRLPRRAYNLYSTHEYQNNHSYNTDDEKETNNIINNNYQYWSRTNKPIRTLSYNESGIQSSTTSNNRLKHLCSRFKRHFILTKERRTRSEDINESASERRMINFDNYKSFSSSIDDPFNEFEWPDFEKVYDSIPACLINALPGLDDYSIEENSNYLLNILNFQIDQTDECSIEQMNLFIKCKRGKYFRRNGLCQKLDKIQYNRQLDIFVRQLMIEKLMRTWT